MPPRHAVRSGRRQCRPFVFMPWLQLTLEAPHHDAQRLSDALEEAGALAVSLEAGNDEPIFETDWGATPQVWRQTRVVALFAEDADITEVMAMTATLLGLTEPPPYRAETVADQDWVRVWMDRWQPMCFGTNLWVVPSWLAPPDPEAVNLILDPGMAFGTGTHPTTALCMEMIETHLKPGDTFLDVGSGSGVLMITAAKVGAQRVCGVDKDHIAVDIAVKNLLRNRLNPGHFCVRTGNLVEQTDSRYDFIAANILTHVILDLLNNITTVLKAGGIFVCSGILEENQDVVIAKMKDIGFDILEVAVKEQWVAVAGRYTAQGSGHKV